MTHNKVGGCVVRRRADKIISELETYLSVCPVEKKTSSDFLIIRHRLDDVLETIAGSYAGEPSSDDEKSIIIDIIRHCDETTQDELIDSFGEDSYIAQLIRRIRVEKYKNSKKPHFPYDVLKESLKQELGGIRKTGNPFYQSVCFYMERIGFEKDSDFYNSIGMPRQQFARLRDAENTLSKKTVLWIITGLGLDYPEASDLLSKAGYSFRKSDIRDVILTYIFRNTEYTLQMVNEVLEHFGIAPFC